MRTGDYSPVGLAGKVAVERKTLVDITNCLAGTERNRFEAELSRAQGMDYFAVIIEAGFAQMTSRQYRCKVKPNEATGILVDLQIKYHVPFVWAGSRRAAEYLTYWTLRRCVEMYER